MKQEVIDRVQEACETYRKELLNGNNTPEDYNIVYYDCALELAIDHAKEMKEFLEMVGYLGDEMDKVFAETTSDAQ